MTAAEPCGAANFIGPIDPIEIGVEDADYLAGIIELLARTLAERPNPYRLEGRAVGLQRWLLNEATRRKDGTPVSGSVKPSAALDVPPLKHRIGVRAAAKILNIKEDSVRDLIENGRLDSVKEGRQHRISVESVQAHKARQISRACR